MTREREEEGRPIVGLRFGEILGQAGALALLRRALSSGRLPHALLFQGAENVGKGTAARALAASILCEAGGEEACGRCGACLRAAHGNHPDLLVVERLPKKVPAAGSTDEETEGEEEAAGRGELRPFIMVSQIREMSRHAAYAPREGRRRVFIVDPADRMNAEAQNALLKTLEEPPGGAILILVASRPHLLLPTVRSRCFPVRFAALPVSELAELLRARGHSEEEALSRAALAGGRPGKALAFDPERLRERRDEILSALEALASRQSALAELSSFASSVSGSDEESLLEGLDLVEGLLRDAALSALSLPASALLHADRAPRLGKLGQRLGPLRATSIVRSVERLRGELRFNLNRTLLTESLLAAVAGGPIP